MNSTKLKAHLKARSRIAATGWGVALAMVVAGAAFAQAPQGGERRGPPKEALQACEGKSVGDACSMKTPRDEKAVQGQCISTRDERVACLPDGGPRPKP